MTRKTYCGNLLWQSGLTLLVPMTYLELAELLQVSESSIARKMKDLQASGEIRRVGADKNGHWEVVGQ